MIAEAIVTIIIIIVMVRVILTLLPYLILTLRAFSAARSVALPHGFTYIRDLDPTIRVNLKYYNGDNFIGWRIPGYNANRGILTLQAAVALSKAQAIFDRDGYSILVYDSYRPQQSVDYFVNWIKNVDDERNKPFYYPRVDKRTFIEEGYVASRSGHSRGSTLDMTIIKKDLKHLERAQREMRNFYGIVLPFMNDNSVDTGTGFDLMDEASHGENNIVSAEHKANREYIRKVMESVGFRVLAEEWWHFTLRDEPFKNTYFNFTVE